MAYRENDLAHILVFGHVAVGFAGLFDGELAVDGGLERAVHEVLPESQLEVRGDFDLFGSVHGYGMAKRVHDCIGRSLAALPLLPLLSRAVTAVFATTHQWTAIATTSSTGNRHRSKRDGGGGGVVGGGAVIRGTMQTRRAGEREW